MGKRHGWFSYEYGLDVCRNNTIFHIFDAKMIESEENQDLLKQKTFLANLMKNASGSDLLGSTVYFW